MEGLTLSIRMNKQLLLDLINQDEDIKNAIKELILNMINEPIILVQTTPCEGHHEQQKEEQ